METIIEVKAEPLSVEGFSQYGTAILLPTTPAPKAGKDWDCWFGFGKITDGNGSIGIVQTRPSGDLITHMEAHLHPEFLIPVTGPIIQAVALPERDGQPGEKPNPATVRAFILEPGQAIIMDRGVWHYAAVPLRDEAWYYFMGNPVWDGPGTPEQPWIPFLGDQKIKIVA
jgi:ureidoglycolate lyase